eukprot:TRINITY_DN8633_c0_g1_i12.p1 TRINITY_DN8633_c0_g1~~TRINITY_DN8633_c0_g1_i12.p1  ORF type:complete len:690 (+),score=116.89 TRINITY_DN8633_c0_g1_i12:113-2182(+)
MNSNNRSLAKVTSNKSPPPQRPTMPTKTKRHLSPPLLEITNQVNGRFKQEAGKQFGVMLRHILSPPGSSKASNSRPLREARAVESRGEVPDDKKRMCTTARHLRNENNSRGTHCSVLSPTGHSQSQRTLTTGESIDHMKASSHSHTNLRQTTETSISPVPRIVSLSKHAEITLLAKTIKERRQKEPCEGVFQQPTQEVSRATSDVPDECREAEVSENRPLCGTHKTESAVCCLKIGEGTTSRKTLFLCQACADEVSKKGISIISLPTEAEETIIGLKPRSSDAPRLIVGESGQARVLEADRGDHDESEWRRGEIDAFLLRLKAVEADVQETISRVEAREASIEAYYDQQGARWADMIRELEQTLAEASRRVYQRLHERKEAAREFYHSATRYFQSVLAEFSFIERDINCNFEEILHSVEKEPFAVILQRYRAQIDGYASNLSELQSKTFDVVRLSHNTYFPLKEALANCDHTLFYTKRVAFLKNSGKTTPLEPFPGANETLLTHLSEPVDVLGRPSANNTIQGPPNRDKGRQMAPKPNPVLVSFENKELFERAMPISGKKQPTTMRARESVCNYSLFRTSAKKGDRGNMSPEQWRGKKTIDWSSEDRKRAFSAGKPHDDVTCGSGSKQKFLSLLEKVATNQQIHNTFYASLIQAKLAKAPPTEAVESEEAHIRPAPGLGEALLDKLSVQ